jgi:hypothetical protein
MNIEEYLTFDTFINNVSFGDEEIEITYMEKHDQSDTVMLAKTMMLPISDEERLQMYLEIQQTLVDLIERGAIELRNPPEEFVDTTENPRQWAYKKMVGGNE